MNTGYRWLRVNEHIYTYTATTILNVSRKPHTEVLAYVQQTEVPGQYRALRSFHFTTAEMLIPVGRLEDVISSVEKSILDERMTTTFGALTAPDTLIEEGNTTTSVSNRC